MAYPLVKCLLSARLYVLALALSGAAESLDRDSPGRLRGPHRANRDPQNAHDWPVDQRQLLADLWALGLWLQREAADMWNNMSAETSVVGRDWERWRAIMTVARLFEQHGVTDLTSDMLKIMSGYQEQRMTSKGHRGFPCNSGTYAHC